MLQKNVKLLLEQLQVCIFAKIVFGVRCTLISDSFFSLILLKAKGMKTAQMFFEDCVGPSRSAI